MVIQLNDNMDYGKDLPMGLGMALAKNIKAMNNFTSLSKETQQNIIKHTHNINSKKEMREYVSQIAENQISFN